MFVSLDDSNRTLSGIAPAIPVPGDDLHQNKNDVTNNPVTGRHYSGGGNGPTLRSFDNLASVATLISNPVSGGMNYDLVGVGPEVLATLRRPPMGNAFNFVKKVTSVRLEPGAIKKDFLTYKSSMVFNSFLNKIKEMLNQTAANAKVIKVRMSIGSFSVLAFEKMCATKSDEPTISIGSELNQIYRARLTEGKSGISSFHEIL